MNVPLMYRLGSTLILGAAFLLAACGQKGPLYLPDTGGEVVTRPAGATQDAPQTPQQASPETAPQPSTQPPQNTTPKPEDEKKGATPR
ncbi:MAG: LPS translocon maturation chaperone LptM [Steroidobacteraceae bacterium]